MLGREGLPEEMLLERSFQEVRLFGSRKGEEEASDLKKGDGGGRLQENPAYWSTVGFVWLQQTTLGDMQQERSSSKSQSPDLLRY